MDSSEIIITRLELGPYNTNAYILLSTSTQKSILVDAPAEAESLAEYLQGTSPQYIIITHSHFDHTGALKELKAKLNVPIAVHPLDAPYIPVRPDILLNDGDYVNLDSKIKILHTPGHTAGSICLLSGKHLISGDTIFPGGPGHTDSPEDFKEIIKSLNERIFILPGETEIFPGHGPGTIISTEKTNYEYFNTKPHSPSLCGDVLWLTS